MARTGPRFRWASAVAAALLLVGVAGCGSVGDIESSDTPVTSTDEPADQPDDTAGSADDTEPGDDTQPGDDEPADDDDDADDSAAGEPLEACELLTEEDVTEVFGEPVEAGVTNSAHECWWNTNLKRANLRIFEPDLDNWRAGLDNDSWEPIDLGDEGYRATAVFDTVEFLVGERVIELNVIFSTRGDSGAALEELVERVGARV